MENQNDIENRNAEYRKGRGVAMGIASFVYVGVVLAATVLFISFVLTAFPANAYLSRLVMTLAGLLVGGSMIAFPISLHNWTVEKTHRRVTIALYYGEMVIIAVNSIVSFTILLLKNSGLGAAPAWVLLYEPFSILSIIYTLFAWGTIWNLDPEHKRKAKDLANQEKFEAKIAERMAEFLESADGEDVIMDIATKRAYEEFSPDRFKTGKKSWGTGRRKALPESDSPALPAPEYQQIDPALLEEIVRQLNKTPVYPVEHGNGRNPTNPPR